MRWVAEVRGGMVEQSGGREVGWRSSVVDEWMIGWLADRVTVLK